MRYRRLNCALRHGFALRAALEHAPPNEHLAKPDPGASYDPPSPSPQDDRLCRRAGDSDVGAVAAPGRTGGQTKRPVRPPRWKSGRLRKPAAGAPASEWDINGAGDATIQGFATDISVNRGETIDFKIDTDATDYQLDIYRHGLLRRHGRAEDRDRQALRDPAADAAGLPDRRRRPGSIDCGNWAVSASWAVPSTRGVGHLLRQSSRAPTPAARATSSSSCATTPAHSDLLFQTSDTTWQAYNQYGGNSLYVGGPGDRAAPTR